MNQIFKNDHIQNTAEIDSPISISRFNSLETSPLLDIKKPNPSSKNIKQFYL